MVRVRPRRRRAKAVRKPQPQSRAALGRTVLQLRRAHSAAIVAVAALRQQNSELDGDIASVLQCCVCDRLAEQLEQLEAASHLPAPVRGL